MFQNPEKGSSFTNDKVVTHTRHSGKGNEILSTLSHLVYTKVKTTAEPRRRKIHGH